jgi:hypothetical protein
MTVETETARRVLYLVARYVLASYIVQAAYPGASWLLASLFILVVAVAIDAVRRGPEGL